MTGDIHGLKGLQHFGYPLWYYVAGIILAILVLGTAFFLVKKILLKKKKSSLPPVEPVRPTEEIALEALRNLRERHYLEGGQERKFHFELSGIFRAYLEGRFQFPATDLTTEEISFHLPRLPFGPEKAEALQLFLRKTDAVKFASQTLGPQEGYGLLSMAQDFIRGMA